MIFKPYYYFETGCAAYLFGCGSLGKCAVVDAHEGDVDAYSQFAAAKNMRITHVIDTHIHADHRSGGLALAAKTGANYCLHESAEVRFPFERLKHRQTIELGNTVISPIRPGAPPPSASIGCGAISAMPLALLLPDSVPICSGLQARCGWSPH